MKRRILSIIMSVIVLVNTYAVSVSAEAVKTTSELLINHADGYESGVSLENIETSSDNVLGGILAETIDEEFAVAGETATEVNRIIDVKVVDTYTMSVKFTADINCTVIVATYDETGVQMLTSGSIEVFADETQAYVDFDDIPDYFFLRAYLVETETMKPLSIQYESDLYTQDMQEFVNKTVDDFEQDKILNFDDDNTANFAVYNDSTIIVEETQGVNTIVLQDDENGIYEFTNADENITTLVSGDVLSYEYSDNEVVLIKVDTINVDGSNVRITGADIEKEDVFEYISVDTISNAEDAKVDTSYMDEDIEYLGLAEGLEENEEQTYASISGKKTLGFEFNLVDKKVSSGDEEDDEKLEVSITGKLNFAVTIKLEFKWSLNKKYFDFELEYVAGFKNVTINAVEYEKKIKKFPEIKVSPVAGVYITFKPTLKIEANASIKVNANLSGSIGFRIKGNGIENISKNPKFKTNVKTEGKVYIGISMEPEVKIFSKYIANASMKAETGVEISMKSCDESKNDMTVSIHDCKKCFEGEINFKLDLSFRVEFAKHIFEKTTIELKSKITDMYYSSDFDEFGFTTCPHIKYKVSVEVKDFLTNEPIEGVLVYDDDCITDAKGKVSFFVPNGKYKIVPVKNGYEYLRVLNIQSDTVSVKNNSKKLSFLMKKTDDSGGGGTGGETENPEDSEKPLDPATYWPDKNKNFIVEPTKDGDLWWSIDEDGLLEIWGKGDYEICDWTWYGGNIKTAKIVVSDITYCDRMFAGCRNLTRIDLSSFNTSNVTDMTEMFYGCNSLTTIDLSNFDTSNVTNMRSMFMFCDSLTRIDLSSFNTSNVTDMTNMFFACNSLTTIDLSSFDTSNIMAMEKMFALCNELQTVYLNINPNDAMFLGCPATVIAPITSSSMNKDDSYVIEKSVKPYTMLTTSYDEAQTDNDEALEVQNTGNMTTKTFTGLKPNAVYNFYDMKDKDAAEPYAADNMLFIIQATSDANGTIEINYVQREPYEDSDTFVIPMHGQVLFGQVESFSASSDASQAVDIKLYNSNDVSMNNAIYEVDSTDGTYEIDDVEAGDYIMSVSKENHVTRCYNITVSDSDVYQDVIICLKGDVTGDGKVNAKDWNAVRDHISYASRITDDYKFKCADVTDDGGINSKDWNAIRDHINYVDRFW